MRALSISLLFSLLALTAAAQSAKRLRLAAPKPRTAASAIRVVSVVDDRSDTAAVGAIRAGLSGKLRPIEIEGGAAAAASAYWSRYQNAAPDAVPVTVHIRQLEITEKAMALKQRLTIQYNYAFVTETGEQAYEGSAYAESNMDVSQFAERLVRESFSNTFDKVADAWKDARAAVNPSVTVSVKIEPQPAGSGLISFDRGRPLQYDDFKGTIDDLSIGAAATYTGISFAYSAQQTGAEFRIIVTLSAIADPEKSWMRPSARQPRVLAHENLHFAITAMMACRLADTMRNLAVTKTDYDSKLRQVFNAIDRQLEQQQRAYDAETVHGTRATEQAAWEQKIAAALKAAECYGY